MNENIPPTAPVATAKTKLLADELLDDVVLAKQIAAAYKTGGKQAVLALLPNVMGELQEDYRAVREALPEIKAGYKTTEFWLVLAVVLGNGAYLAVTGKALPVDLNVVLGGMIAVYAAARALLKHNSAK